MLKQLLLIGMVASLPLAGSAQDPTEKSEFWFPVGEKLTYAIGWGPWTVGYSTAWTEWIEEDGRTLLAIRLRNRSTSVLDTLYPVDDFMESIVDPVTFLPLRFTKRLSEGRYRLHEVTTFEHQKGVAHWQHLLRDSHEDFAIEPDTRDLLSFMYFMRSKPWEDCKSYHFKVMADEKLYDLYATSRGYEEINVPDYGKVRSLKMVPEAAFQGLFVRVGRLEVWVSDDDRCIATKGTAIAPFPIGTIRILLNKVEGPGDDSWSDTTAAMK